MPLLGTEASAHLLAAMRRLLDPRGSQVAPPLGFLPFFPSSSCTLLLSQPASPRSLVVGEVASPLGQLASRQHQQQHHQQQASPLWSPTKAAAKMAAAAVRMLGRQPAQPAQPAQPSDDVDDVDDEEDGGDGDEDDDELPAVTSQQGLKGTRKRSADPS